MTTQNVCLTIHGHFYQPPRENPGIGVIEKQAAAAPFHDWNERIHHESYRPNFMARVLDEHGKIINIVNNFEQMSFNFGPTLFSWLQSNHPRTYRAILAADRKSVKRHKGHGNAIAQIYNHVIMPLANLRDKKTQVIWGIRDFEFHFERKPEGMWLSETACDEETLEILMEHEIKFTILAPQQAARVRPLKGGVWKDVSDGSIDPRHAYRFFSPKDPQKFIDLFFYDGPLAGDLGFGSLAFDARAFADRIELAKGASTGQALLIHVATDGETFGHHKAFGDRTLAYLLSVEAPRRHLRIVNYGEFLSENPPEYEVKIHLGEDGKGSSWSCRHGVKRWAENCGCRSGGPAEWTQEWRKPLRQTLEWLRDKMASRYELCAGAYFKDVWKARNDSIEILFEGTEKTKKIFFKTHASRELKKEEKILCLKWLESQRLSLFMFTSCGWFFDEISGIEASQVLFYALEAIALLKELTGEDCEPAFLERMSHAKSNIKELRNGRVICERMVKPRLYRFSHLTAAYGMGLLVPGKKFQKLNQRLYGYELEPLQFHEERKERHVFSSGRLKIRNLRTGEERHQIFWVMKSGADFKAFVKSVSSEESYPGLHRLHRQWKVRLSLSPLLGEVKKIFGNSFFTLADIPFQERVDLLTALHQEVVRGIHGVYQEIYQINESLSEIYRSVHLPLPREMRFAAEHSLGPQFMEAFKDLMKGYHFRKALRVFRILAQAKSLEIHLSYEDAIRLLSERLFQLIHAFCHSPSQRRMEQALYFIRLAEKLHWRIDIREAQNELFARIQEWNSQPDRWPSVLRKKDLGPRFLAAMGFNPLIGKERYPHAAPIVA
ncbi:MAG: DUF3536 domain-containing protein [Candidatus Omnitrophica bacterium]|nr:DUF3536 domain-containing protein [Candidatus Omnitrophota bacterium]